MTALAIIIGLAAIWGYGGLKEALTAEVRENADKAMQAKIGEYPDSREIIGLFNEMREFHETQKLLSNQLLSESASKSVARTSNRGQDEVKKRVRIAREYPGKGK